MSKVVLTDMRADTRPSGSSGSPAYSGPFARFRSLSPLGVLVTRSEVVLGGLFLFAAYNKLRRPNGPQLFSESIHAFKLGLPDSLMRLATGVTPWVETIAALCLLLGVFTRAAATIIGALLVLFIVLLSSVLIRGLNAECGCFGNMSPFCPDKISTCNIWQNLILLSLALVIVLTPRHKLVSSQTGA